MASSEAEAAATLLHVHNTPAPTHALVPHTHPSPHHGSRGRCAAHAGLLGLAAPPQRNIGSGACAPAAEAEAAVAKLNFSFGSPQKPSLFYQLSGLSGHGAFRRPFVITRVGCDDSRETVPSHNIRKCEGGAAMQARRGTRSALRVQCLENHCSTSVIPPSLSTASFSR